VGRQQHDEREPVPGQGPGVLDGEPGQRFRAKRQRAGKMAVPVRAANTNRRGQHRAQPPGYFSTDGIGQDRISAKRQVAAVMLDRSERHHRCRGAALNELLELARGQALQLVHALAHD
jgi:hypothetical protein